MVHRPRLSPSIARVVVAAASVAVTLGVVEWTLRSFFPIRGMIYQIDDRYLYKHIPGSVKRAGPAGGDTAKVLVRINAAGRRGDESGLPTAAYRVVVYGDSFVAAESTSQPETYTAQLQLLLNEKLRGTVVLNAGVTGYGVDQESLRMEDELPGLKPNLVVVAIYVGNDFGDLLRDKLYRLDEHGQLKRNVPVIDDSLRRAFHKPAELSSIQIIRAFQTVYEKGQQDESPSLGGIAPVDQTAVYLEHRRAEYENYVLGEDNIVRNFLADEYDADVSVQPDSPSARYRVLLMARVLERIRGLADQNGARVFVLVIPEQCDVKGGCAVSAARGRYPGYRPTGLTDAVESIVRSEGIPYLNLFEPFRQTETGLYHPMDGHWNSSGQQLAARLSADMILRDGLLRAASSAKVPEK